MANYLVIESRDFYESSDSKHLPPLLHGLRERGNEVTLFLIQNAVLTARTGAVLSETYSALAKAGIQVLADRFSLRARAIDRLAAGVIPTELDSLVRLLVAPGTKAIWH
jgi:sulfur transfer complex TusBCD TusB component (DsrH family)